MKKVYEVVEIYGARRTVICKAATRRGAENRLLSRRNSNYLHGRTDRKLEIVEVFTD